MENTQKETQEVSIVQETPIVDINLIKRLFSSEKEEVLESLKNLGFKGKALKKRFDFIDINIYASRVLEDNMMSFKNLVRRDEMDHKLNYSDFVLVHIRAFGDYYIGEGNQGISILVQLINKPENKLEI